ncbi:MAG: protein TolQ [Gammaproteobacteria bacterium]|nr:protein TolQ [Gammaproteobacteria bacterium]
MNTDLSFVQLILDASVVVQLVMVSLLIASVASWAIIFQKRRTLRIARATSDQFESQFWSGGDLAAIYRTIATRDRDPQAMESIFATGFREFQRLNEQPTVSPGEKLEGARRAMRVSQMKQIDNLERSLATLATVGSTSPYVGLFGTVWGIMNAFRSLGNVQHATLSMVAPGIAEALIATAMGLFAAIPAVIFYNRYADQVDRLESRFDTFTEEFSAILSRHARS